MDAISQPTGSAQVMPLHLLRLVSQGQPVGGFSYSRGLEAAFEAGWVQNETTARDWILGTLHASITALDGALFWRMANALEAGDADRFRMANAWLAAGRESREFQLEDRRLAQALLRLLDDLEVPAARSSESSDLTFAGAFALATHHWRIAPALGLNGLLWIYVEGQVNAGMRLIPLGQLAGQRILVEAVDAIERAGARARSLADNEIGSLSPALAMASAWHETQYSRLFQS